MASIGETFKTARLAKGVDVVGASRITRIKQSQLVAMEKDDFRSIPAPVYVRGFIKQYALYLGLDPVPLIADYNASLGGSYPAAPPTLRPAGTGPSPRSEPAPPAPPPPPPPPPPPAPETIAPPVVEAVPVIETPAPETVFSWPSSSDAPPASEPVSPVSTGLFSGLKPVEPPPAPPPPASAPVPPRFQPVVMETGAPELLHRATASPTPEKVPPWKEPVVMETGRIVRERQQQAGAGDRFRSPEPAKPAASGDRNRGPLFPPGVMRKVGIALGAFLLLVIVFRSCGGGRPDYESVRDVPIPDNPVLREPSDPYIQSR